MFKLVASGIWIVIVTVVSAYAAVTWQAGRAAPETPSEFFGGLDYVKTNIISVPIISRGKVEGYVVAQLVFTVDGKLVERMSVPPDMLLVDAAFRTIYSGPQPDFDYLERYDLATLTSTIKDTVNARLGSEIVHDVMIEVFNAIEAESVRKSALSR